MLLSMSTRISEAEFYAKLGYDAIDVDLSGVVHEGDRHDSILDGDDWLERIEAERARCNQLGIQIHSIHMPYKYQFTEDNYPKKYEMMCKALVAADKLGAKWAVMHIKPTEQMVELVQRMLVDTQVKNVRLAFENSSNKKIEHLVEIHDTLKAKGYDVGICLDLGHCHMNIYNEYDVVKTIYELGERIKMLHIHDNFRNDDSHTVPYIGTIPWENVMRALKDVGYAGVFNYEIAMHWIPQELKLSYAKYCIEVAHYLMRIFDA